MLQAGDFIAQGESALFEPAHHQLVSRGIRIGAVYQCIEITVFHAQLNQAPRRGVVIRFQGQIGGSTWLNDAVLQNVHSIIRPDWNPPD